MLADLQGFEPHSPGLESGASPIMLQIRGIPHGTRTRISNVKGCRPNQLDEGDV